MKTLFSVLITAAVAASITTDANALDGYFGHLERNAPRSEEAKAVTAARTVFDQLNETAPVRGPEAGDSLLAGE